ncbi:hypothetical protein UG55_10326 [Frankia sp. EI5c]|uniref:hypothetical protein n=1 Tax=Frankia sp. EI5c TaxID=683316 RepID=UPI0007C3306B|nr:hypothetical protein [Frankia sp. EI5c]OAA23973.1 hypothetical protein UG55_10326 [Frankia sp. EI5c]
MRRGTDAGAALFVCCALANALGVAGMARVFRYPGVLNEPAGAALTALGSRIGTLALLTSLTAVAAFLLVPLTTAVIRAGYGDPAPARRGARWLLLCLAMAAGLSMMFEWSLWLVAVPLLAHPVEVPGRITPDVLTFDSLRVTAGLLSGEIIGPLLLAGWTALVATRFVGAVLDSWWPFGPLRPVGRGMSPRGGSFGRLIATARVWTDWLRLRGLLWARPALVGGGLLCSALLVAGAASTAGLVSLPPVPVLARLVWSLWMAAVGTAVWVRVAPRHDRPGYGPRRRPIALAPSPPATGPRTGGHPAAFERIPYRFAAYDAAVRRDQSLPRPGQAGSGPHISDDAVTVAGDEVIVQVAAWAPVPRAEDADAQPGNPAGDRPGAPPMGTAGADGAEDPDPPTEIVSSQDSSTGNPEPRDLPERPDED